MLGFMCRNITELRGLEPASPPRRRWPGQRASTLAEVSGSITRPTDAVAGAFESAVAEVAATTRRLLAELPPRRQPPKTDSAASSSGGTGKAHAMTAGPATSEFLPMTAALQEWAAAVHALLDGR